MKSLFHGIHELGTVVLLCLNKRTRRHPVTLSGSRFLTKRTESKRDGHNA